MPSIYDINFSLQWERISPPSKRKPGLLNWGKVLLYPLQWSRDLFFKEYVYGDESLEYKPTTVYKPWFDWAEGTPEVNKRYRARYNNKVYECIKSTTGNRPTDTDYWIQVLDDWRGVYERMNYGPRKLIFEYLLNRWFYAKYLTEFRQPIDGTSDIWIEILEISDQMLVAEDSEETYLVPIDSNEADAYVGENADFNPTSYDFVVHYPDTLVLNTSDSEGTAAEKNARSLAELNALVDRYKLYGTIPALQVYTKTV